MMVLHDGIVLEPSPNSYQKMYLLLRFPLTCFKIRY